MIGGGLLGLEAAKAVYDLDTLNDVTIIHRQAFPLSRQLDNLGGEIVRNRIEALGVTWLGSTSVARLETDAAGALSALVLSDGTSVPCSVAIFAIGITPRDELARASGITCARDGRHGVVVDDGLRTSAPDVFAIGECASWRENTYGLIAPGIEMADILAFNMTQTATELGAFRPRTMNNPDLSTKLKLMGVDVRSALVHRVCSLASILTVQGRLRPLETSLQNSAAYSAQRERPSRWASSSLLPQMPSLSLTTSAARTTTLPRFGRSRPRPLRRTVPL